MTEKLVSKYLPYQVFSRIKKLGGKFKVINIVEWSFEDRKSFEEAKEILRNRGDLL